MVIREIAAISQPATVGRPGTRKAVQLPLGPAQRFIYIRSKPSQPIVDFYFHCLINEGQLFTVGRPEYIITEPLPVRADLMGRSFLIGLHNPYFVFTRLIAPVGHPFSVGRP